MLKLDTNILSKNIVKYYGKAEKVDIQAGNFYSLAGSICQDLSTKYNVNKVNIAGIMAVLSPGTFWEQNVKDTEAFLKGKRSGFATYGQFVEKAKNILQAKSEEEIYEIAFGKQGHKTASFFLNIIGNYTVVTIDRHAYRVALGDTGAGGVRMTTGQYKKIEAAYILAARKLSINPVVLQAVTWHQFKRLNERGNYSEVNNCPF